MRHSRLFRPVIASFTAFAMFLTAIIPRTQAASTFVTDIEHWTHPTKAVFAKYGVTLNTIELVDKTYPIFNVELPKSATLQQKSGYLSFLQALAKANGYWSFTVQDGSRFAKVTASASDKKITNISYSGMETYFNYSLSGRTITLAQAGLHPLPVNAYKGALNSRIAALLKKPDQYTDKDYRSGLRMNEFSSSGFWPPIILIDGRSKQSILGKLKIGDAMSAVRKTLGKPSYIADATLYYKFGAYYVGLRGKTNVELAIITLDAPLDYPDLLSDVVQTLNATEDLSDLSGLRDDASLMRYFNGIGHIHGGGWHTESYAGIEIEDFDDRTITVFNDFTGKLLQPNEDDAYDIVYVNEDSTVNRMRSVLGSYDYGNRLFREEGVRSPNGKYIAIYEWLTSDSQYFTIRFADASSPDFIQGARVFDDFYWISDNYMMYQDFNTQIPYLLRIDPKADNDYINVMHNVGIPYDEESIDNDIQIAYVNEKSFGIKIDGKAYKIDYSLDAKGVIKLKLAGSK